MHKTTSTKEYILVEGLAETNLNPSGYGKNTVRENL